MEPSPQKTTTIKVLAIDDNPTFLKTVRNYLKRYDFIDLVGTAENGEEGLEKAQELQPDIVLIDLNMPNLPGLQLIPRLRGILPSVGLIALTLMEEGSYRDAASRLGSDAFVSKYHMMEELAPAIRQVADMYASASPL